MHSRHQTYLAKLINFNIPWLSLLLYYSNYELFSRIYVARKNTNNFYHLFSFPDSVSQSKVSTLLEKAGMAVLKLGSAVSNISATQWGSGKAVAQHGNQSKIVKYVDMLIAIVQRVKGNCKIM